MFNVKKSFTGIQMCLISEYKDLRDMDLEIFEVKCITYEETPTRARLNAEKQVRV